LFPISQPRITQSLPAGLVLLGACAILVPMLGLAVAGWTIWRSIESEAETRLHRTVEMLREHATSAFATQEAILAAAGHASAGRSWTELRSSEAMHSLLADLAEAGGDAVRGVLLLDDMDRIVSASYEFPARPVELKDRDYVRALRADPAMGIAIGEVVASRPMGWPLFVVARRAVQGREGLAGIIVSSFSPETFSVFYASVVESPLDAVGLLRADGAVLARHPALSAGEEAQRRFQSGQLQTDVVESVVRSISPFRGVERIYATRKVGAWPVMVTYGLAMDPLRAAWWRRMILPSLGAGSAVVVLLGMTGLAAYGIRQQAQAEERERLAERRLAQSERVAVVGLLAAGLSHDLKNLVQIMRSGARIVQHHAENPIEVRLSAALLGDAADRGALMVEGLLGLARGAAVEESEATLDVSATLADLTKLLTRAFGRPWNVRLTLPSETLVATASKAGFEAAVVNLLMNARDATPQGGILGVDARTLHLPFGKDRKAPSLAPGPYVVVTINDEGLGMDAATLARTGEQFFTTKPQGQGTGLGLATARQFCDGAGGALTIVSALGQGTSVRLWLPAATDDDLPGT